MKLRPSRWKRILIITATVAISASLLAPAAVSQSADDLRARAQELDAQLSAAESREIALGEQMNAAAERLAEAQSAIEEAQQRIAAAQEETDRLHTLVNDRAAAAYKQAGGGNAFADLDVDNAGDFEARSKYSSAAADQDKRLMHQLALAQEELAVQKDEAERIRGQAESEKASLDSARAEAEAATAEIASIKSQVQGELADLLASERAAREAAAAEQWQEQAASEPTTGGGGGGGGPTGPIPGANGGAGGAVSFALSKVGGPYCWGGTGPSCYDCSGLTQAAWAHGGLGIPRTSGAQFSAYPQVPLSAIQPGDLLFRDHGGSGHVAMATGGGMMVHATSSSNNPNAIRHEGISGISFAVRPG